MSVQPVADQYEDTTMETTDVGFTFAGGETEAASPLSLEERPTSHVLGFVQRRRMVFWIFRRMCR